MAMQQNQPESGFLSSAAGQMGLLGLAIVFVLAVAWFFVQ